MCVGGDNVQKIKIEENVDIRIDSYLAEYLNVSRSKILKMLKSNSLLVNNKPVKASYCLRAGDEVMVNDYEETPMTAEAEEMNLDIVYEDDDVIVVNKANGVVVHPAVGNETGTLVNGLLHHSKELSGLNGEFRPGIVHRLDADTTGLLMIAKNDKAHAILAEQLSKKETTRVYYALVWGRINHDTGTIDAPIGRDKVNRKQMTVTAENSKHAVTHVHVLKRYQKYTLVECELETGRTHQIRVHMAYIGYPVHNDPVYNKKKSDEFGQFLHSEYLKFIHPITKEKLEFRVDVPEYFQNFLDTLEKRD